MALERETFIFRIDFPGHIHLLYVPTYKSWHNRIYEQIYRVPLPVGFL